MSLVLGSVITASAASANISRSYYGPTGVPNGSLVSLDTDKQDYVVPANTTNASKLLGVTLATADSLLAVNGDSTKIQVATSGTVSVLVSTVNGDVKVGDQISVSPFSGVGMKAALGSHTIGLAQTALDSNTTGMNTQEVVDKSGKTTKISVGLVRVGIAVGIQSSTNGGNQPNSLQKLGKSLTGHTISTPRIVAALLIAIVSTVALITLIYASIFGSIISIGRNPLAKNAVFRSLAWVVGMSALIAVVAAALIIFLLN